MPRSKRCASLVPSFAKSNTTIAPNGRRCLHHGPRAHRRRKDRRPRRHSRIQGLSRLSRCPPLCTSINQEVVHGMPNEKRILKDGDILSIDRGCIVDGFYSDAAVTYAIGSVTPTNQKPSPSPSPPPGQHPAVPCRRRPRHLLAVQTLCEAAGFGVVREFVGHGIGSLDVSEDPQVPNFWPARKGPRLKAGMVLAIEPMINAGRPEGPRRSARRYGPLSRSTAATAAHFEYTVAITKSGPPQVLTL